MLGAGGQIRGKVIGGAVSALTAALLTPAAALGSNGEITRALANADWTLGDIAARVSWSGCAGGAGPSACAWIPYMTLGPGASPSECDSPERDWPGLGEHVALAFGGGGFKGPGTYSHDDPMVALRGRPEQLACLFALERNMGARAPRSLRLDAVMLTASPTATEAEIPPTTGEEPETMDGLPDKEPAESPSSAEEPPGAQEPPAEEEPPSAEEPSESELPSEEEPLAEAEPPGEEEPSIPAEEPATPLLEEEPPFVDEPPRPPSAEVTRAFASADRTRGSIAGSFTWDGCAKTGGDPSSYCAWIPYATIGPGATHSGCASPERDWSSLGEDVSLVLWGGEAIGAGTDEFDFPGIWIDGSSDLLCLAVVEVTAAGTYTHRLDAAPLTASPMVSDAKAVAEN